MPALDRLTLMACFSVAMVSASVPVVVISVVLAAVLDGTTHADASAHCQRGDCPD